MIASVRVTGAFMVGPHPGLCGPAVPIVGLRGGEQPCAVCWLNRQLRCPCPPLPVSVGRLMWKAPAAFPQDSVLAVDTQDTERRPSTPAGAVRGVIYDCSSDMTSPGSQAPGSNITPFRAKEPLSTFPLWCHVCQSCCCFHEDNVRALTHVCTCARERQQ